MPYPWRVLIVIVFGMIPAFQDQSISQIVINQIRGPFGTTAAESQLITTAYFIGVFSTNVGGGYFCTRYGARRIYFLGLVVFMAASVLCALAPSIEALIGARLLMAVGAGLIGSAGLALLFGAIAAEHNPTPGPAGRPALMACALTAILFSTQVSPVVGTYLYQIGDWRWEYWVNLPVMALALLLGMALLRETPTNPAQRPDRIGWLLAVTFVSSLLWTGALGPTTTTTGGWDRSSWGYSGPRWLRCSGSSGGSGALHSR